LTNKTLQENTPTKYKQTKYSKTKLPWFGCLLGTGNKIGLFYDAPEPTDHHQDMPETKSGSSLKMLTMQF